MADRLPNDLRELLREGDESEGVRFRPKRSRLGVWIREERWSAEEIFEALDWGRKPLAKPEVKKRVAASSGS